VAGPVEGMTRNPCHPLHAAGRSAALPGPSAAARAGGWRLGEL